ncbi:MAG: cyclic-phosphate processing receiver domain-containing protein [Planctomycetota bacterium]
MASIRLWLDDERDPTDSTIQRLFGSTGDEVWVKTVEDAVELLESRGSAVVSISLDNDLGIPGSENEGFRVAQYIERRAGVYGIAPPSEMKVHSANPIRRGEMAQAFANARRLGGGSTG